MRRKILKVTVSIIIVVILPINLQARADDIFDAQGEALDIDKISSSAPEDLKGLSVQNALESERWLKTLWTRLKAFFGDEATKSLKCAVAVFLVSLFCGAAGSIREEKGFDAVSLAGVLSVAIISLGASRGVMELTKSASDEFSSLSKLILPTLTTVGTATGAITSAAIKSGASMLFIELAISLSDRVVLPLITAYFALSVAGCASGEKSIKAVADIIKKLVIFLLTAITLVFTVYLSVSGLVAESADAVTAKVAKNILSSSLPIVGSMISDAAATILSGAGLLRNSIGVFGMISVCGICLAPCLKLSVSYVSFKLSRAISASLSGGNVGEMIDAAASTYAMSLALIGSQALMMFFSFLSLIKAVI